jgi:predicted MFS family arabinose efflux permease
MFEKPAARRTRDVDYRLLVPLILNAIAVQVVVVIARVTTSYRVVELDLPVVWLGVIAAVYAILPVFLALWIGRVMDRGHDALIAWIGCALLVAGCAGLLVSFSSVLFLLVSTAVLGTGHLFIIASQQMLCVRCADMKARESVFGNYMLACAAGQGIGPYIVGWSGGSATVPPTQFLFGVSLISAVLALALALAMRPSRERRPLREGAGATAVWDLLRVPGLAAVMAVSVICTTATDLIVIYLPLLGAERSIDVADIGSLLTVRAAASMVSRFLYSRLVGIVGRLTLMIATILAAACGFAALAAPLPLALMYPAIAALGFGLGIAITLSITGTLALTTPDARGTANSLRLLGNRFGQVAVPFGASLVAAVTGSAGIFVIMAVALAASAASVVTSAKDKPAGPV